MTLRSKTPKYVLKKLSLGIRRRCPSCEQRGLFKTFYSLHSTCPYCACRFERRSGDTIGSVYINVLLAELTALIGFIIVQAVFSPSISAQLMFWVPYILIFSVFFYPVARSLWVAVLYLKGNVYPDPDYTREYYGPTNPISMRRAGTGEENT